MTTEELKRQLELIEQALSTKLPENSFVILQVEEPKIERLARVVAALEDVFVRHKIDVLICPNDIKITVVPPGEKPQVVAHAAGLLN